MRFIKTLMLLCVAFSALSAETPNVQIEVPTPAVSLSDLASRADLVVLAQARDTDYFMRRDIPVSGSAYLKVLIPYKSPEDSVLPDDIIEVYEKGLHARECYFPNPTVFEEGRRYLLFLKQDPEVEDRYRGMPEGCAIDVLVDSNNRYALRYPVSGIRLSDPLEPLATAMEFRDPYAVVDDEALPPAEREAMLNAGHIVAYTAEDNAIDTSTRWAPDAEPKGRQWIYTRGIDLTAARKLMFTGPASGALPDQAVTRRVDFATGQLHPVISHKRGQQRIQ